MGKFTLPSHEEIKNSSQYPENKPLKAGNYIIKLAKIDFELRPAWNAKLKSFDYSNLDWVYKIIALPYGMENGDDLLDADKTLVEPLTRWIFKEVNPYAIGFLLDNATPSNMRALLCYLTGQNTQGRIVPEGFILLNEKKEIVTDKKIIKEFLDEQEKDIDERDYLKKGFRAVPDIRPYEGNYISASVEIDAKGRNKISKFNEISSKFKPVEDQEKIDKFNESYRKMQEKKKTQSNAPVSEAAVETEEIKVEEIPF